MNNRNHETLLKEWSIKLEETASHFDRQFSSLKDELDQVGQLLRDAISKLTSNFNAIEQGTRKQSEWIEGLIPLINHLPKEKQFPQENGATFDHLSRVNQEIRSKISNAVTALQFEDMVTQLLGKILKRAEKMEQVQNKLRRAQIDSTNTRLMGGVESEGHFQERLARFKEAVNEAVVTLEDHSQSTILQQDLSAGTVDLF